MTIKLKRGRDPGERAAPDARTAAQAPGAKSGRDGSSRPAGAAGDAFSSNRTARRPEIQRQRERFIAAIRAARRARLRTQRAAEGTGGGDEDAGTGALDEQSIRDSVQAIIAEIKTCYENQLKVQPRLGGRMVVEFRIIGEPGVGGVVDRARILETSDAAMRSNEELSECILDSIYALELPAPESGGTVVVDYPFLMTPEEPAGPPR